MNRRPIDWGYKKINNDFYIIYIKDFDICKINPRVKLYNEEIGYEKLEINVSDNFNLIHYGDDKDYIDINLAIMNNFNNKDLIDVFNYDYFKKFVNIMNYINNEDVEINEEDINVDNIENDIINKPNHYQINIKGNNIEVIDIIDEVVKNYKPQEAFKIANVIKYVLRASKKNGKEDLKKARKYIEMLLEME